MYFMTGNWLLIVEIDYSLQFYWYFIDNKFKHMLFRGMYVLCEWKLIIDNWLLKLIFLSIV